MPVPATERVEVWNTLFKLTREQAIPLKKSQNPTWKARPKRFKGGTLDKAQIRSLATVAWCYLALEARANHLIAELVDESKLSQKKAEKVGFLGTQEKWALLPKLWGKSAAVDFSRGPHQAVAQLCSLRNDLFHVNYARLLRKLPKPRTALSLFNSFVYAMEDMNVILGRHAQADPDVLGIALDY
jgi:hypothetical protein